ncbi:MAG: hypothetical protein JWR07_4059 [Nevskia sp.]|nr:hypothetical protein [Nevskia sp.]
MASHGNRRQPPTPPFLVRLRGGNETEPEATKADWAEKMVGGFQSGVRRLWAVFTDMYWLLRNPQTLLDSEEVQREKGIRPLLFFIFSPLLAALIMFGDRCRAALFNTAYASAVASSQIKGLDLLFGFYKRALDVIQSPERSFKVMFPVFLVGVVIHAVVGARAKGVRRKAWRAAVLYTPAFALIMMVAAIELTVGIKVLASLILPTSLIGSPYKLGSLAIALPLLVVTYLCTRVLYAAAPSPKRWIRHIELAPPAYGLLVFAILVVAKIDHLEQSLGDPTLAYVGQFDVRPAEMLSFASQKPLPLSLTNHSDTALVIAPDSVRLRLTYDGSGSCPHGFEANGSNCEIPVQVLNSDDKDWITIPAGETRILRIKSVQALQFSDPKAIAGFRCVSVDMDIVQPDSKVQTFSSMLAIRLKSPAQFPDGCNLPT